MAKLSTAFVMLAAICWGLSGGIGGMLMAYGWDPLVVSFYRDAIAMVRLGIVLLTRLMSCR